MHTTICSATEQLRSAAGTQGSTLGIGIGIGGNAGIIGFVGAGAQLVADPQGNVGLEISFSGAWSIGAGALGGVQLSASNAQSIYSLRGNSSGFTGGLAAEYGASFDYLKDPTGAIATGTLTAGVGAEGKLTIPGSIGLEGAKSFVPNALSTHCP